MHSISSFLEFYHIGNIERWRYSSSLIIIASRRSKHMHIISIKIIMCSSKTQPINIILNKGKLLRYSVFERIQKDNRTIMCGCNSNNLIFNIRNYSKFISISINSYWHHGHKHNKHQVHQKGIFQMNHIDHTNHHSIHPSVSRKGN